MHFEQLVEKHTIMNIQRKDAKNAKNAKLVVGIDKISDRRIIMRLSDEIYILSATSATSPSLRWMFCFLLSGFGVFQQAANRLITELWIRPFLFFLALSHNIHTT
jgi:hypothetical protein